MCCSSNTGQGSSSSIDRPTDSFVTLRKGYDIGYLEEVAEIFEDPDEAIVDEKSADSSEKDANKLSAGEQSARSKIRRCTVSTEEMPGTTEDPLTKLKVVNEGTSKQPEGAKGKHTKPDKDKESLHMELEEAVRHCQSMSKICMSSQPHIWISQNVSYLPSSSRSSRIYLPPQMMTWDVVQ